jgi:hypothetical protein
MNDDKAIMSAAIAASLQQTFTGLMAQPARIGDVEMKTAPARTLAPAPQPTARRPITPPASAAVVPF